MKRLIRGICLASVCLVFSLGSMGSMAAGNLKAKAAEAETKISATKLSADTIESKALSVPVGIEGVDEPLYAGTSTWFLLSIALLGSIAVQRRTVDTAEQPES